MKRPAFWLMLGLPRRRRRRRRRPLLPPGLLDRLARHHDGSRAARSTRAREIMARDGSGRPATGRRRRSACDEETQTFVELEGGGKEAFTRMLRERPLRGLHLARPPLRGRRDQRDDDPLHARRPAVRLRRAARRSGARAPRSTRRRRARIAEAGARASRQVDVDLIASRSSSRARSGGRAAASTTPSPTSGPRRRSTKDATGCSWSSPAIG